MTLPLLPFDKPIVRGRLVRRYQRFFADCVLDDGRPLTAHTANTGSMRGLIAPDRPVLLSDHSGSARKLSHSLEAIEIDGAWVGVNTALPNAFVAAAIAAGLIDELPADAVQRREVRYGAGDRSRIDVLLTRADGSRVFVEVKNVTLREGSCALFPDAVSARGTKHLEDLAAQVRAGDEAALVFLAQRRDCASFAPAAAIDPVYAAAFTRALDAGVRMICAVASVDERGLSFAGRLPVAAA